MDLIIISLSIETSLLLATYSVLVVNIPSIVSGCGIIYQYPQIVQACNWLSASLDATMHLNQASLVRPRKKQIFFVFETWMHKMFQHFLSFSSRSHRQRHGSLSIISNIFFFFTCECHSIWQRWMISIDINVKKKIIMIEMHTFFRFIKMLF